MSELFCVTVLLLHLMSVVAAIRCFHGTEYGSQWCKCHSDYVGQSCERKMHCAGFRRHPDGSCMKCAFGYREPECIWKECGSNGKLNEFINECNCTEPYSGEFCEELKRERVLHYYNTKVTKLGAFGGLIILPLIILHWSCNALERRRKVRRVGKAIKDEIERKRSVAQVHRQKVATDVGIDAKIAESLLMRNLAREDEL